MGIIKKLSAAEIQKIAAGQVVERPASVVKELVENSLDANATAIRIYIEQGGHSLIRVVDNGCGMVQEDALACIENHATSKIISINDLSSISTYGFRGEAIASIAAVSKMTLLTLPADQKLGTQLTVEEGVIQKIDSVPSPVGTDITVRDLFFNVPARRKFLKKEESEWRAIVHIFQALCLSYPQVTFELFSNNISMYHCPKTTSLKNRAIQVLDDRASHHFLNMKSNRDEGIEISGILSSPQIGRYNKNHIFMLVNRRWTKNYTLINAFIKGYAQTLPEGKYPVGIVEITIDPLLIDINVDPRKEEIRFAHPRQIETLIANQVRITLEENTKKATLLRGSSEQPHTDILSPSLTNPSPFSPNNSIAQPSFFDVPLTTSWQGEITNNNVLPANEISKTLVPLSDTTALITDSPTTQQSFITLQEESSAHLIGILHNTYLLVQQHDGLVVVDQHAAHERILFEQCAQRFGKPETIPLLFPTVIQITKDQHNLFTLLQPILHEYGIDAAYVGQNEVLIRATPVHLKHMCYKEFFTYAFNWISHHEHLEKKDFHQQLQHSLQAQMACKAAVKAGDQLSFQQAEQLLRDLYKTPHCFSCPHGRPTIWPISISELERKFKRRV